MAAYAAVLSLWQTLDTILHSDGLPTSLNRRQLESLHEKVSFLQQFLENPLRKTTNQEASDILESKIRDAASEAEYLIETHISNSPGRKIKQIGNPLVSFLVFVVKNAVFLVKNLCHFVVKKILPDGVRRLIFLFVLKLSRLAIPVPTNNPAPGKEGLGRLIEKIGFIVNEVNEIKSAEDLRPTKDLLHSGSSARSYYEVTRENVVLGLDSDLEEMRARLTGGSDNLEVVPIIGMGGIGKTTLARQVSNCNYLGPHFDVCAWVTISQEYSLRQVLIGLLDSMRMFKEDMNKMAEAKLGDSLHKCLKDRRYLMVLDDVWDTDIWDKVRMSFPEDGNGSRVLLTTRLKEVAFYTNSGSSLHQMRFLNQDESWNLLCSKVFGDKECPCELKQIGEKIAGNCRGLPLAITVICGLLSKGSRTKEYWRSIADNLNSVFTKDDDQCMKILSLSYNNLPLHLRPCFLYMGAFPEDYEIPVFKLIRLWAAEGFLVPHISKSVEELAEEYLIDLVERNLVLVCKKSANGKIITCSVHDLLRNLCRQNAHKEKFLYVVKCNDDILRKDINTISRLSIHPNFESNRPHQILNEIKIHNSRIHSLLCSGANLIFPSTRVYLDHKLLRVLDLIVVRLFDFPSEIVTLVNLRYLALTCFTTLPPSITQLQNLETLVYSWAYYNCPFLFVEVWMMPKLRHVCVTPSFFPIPLIAKSLANTSFPLENLQTLLEVRNLRFSEDILERVPNLKTLEVSYDVSLSLVWSSYKLEALVNLRQLETLKILIKNFDHASEIVDSPKLRFPHSLKRLTLGGCFIPWRCMKVIIGALPNLEVLILQSNAFRGSEWVVEGEFCQLKYLPLKGLDLAKWSAAETHFPCLECLIIRSCNRLKEIPSDIGKIPTLEMIELDDCLSSAETSAKRIEEEQKDLGNENPKVHVYSKRW